MTRSDLPAQCDCGTPVEPCVGCGSPRCSTCEPYLSDDCDQVLAPTG